MDHFHTHYYDENYFRLLTDPDAEGNKVCFNFQNDDKFAQKKVVF